MAGVDREELAVREALVLPAPPHGVAIGRHEEERLVLAELLGRLPLRRHDAPVLDEARLHVLVAVGVLGLEHELGVSVGILTADDLELLRGDARDARQVVRERLGDCAGGYGVGGGRGLEAVDLSEDRLARGDDALGTLKRPRVRGVLGEHPVAFVVVELHDVALVEMLEDRRERVEVVSIPHAHHRIADLREELALDLLYRIRGPLVRAAVDEAFKVARINVVVLEGRCERTERMLVRELAVSHHLGRLREGEFRDGRDSRRVRAPGEHYLFAERLALALLRKGGVVLLEHVQRVAALVGVDVGHQSPRVVRRPVVAVDEARLHAVLLELLEENGVRIGSVDAHSRADQAFLDLVFNGCRTRLEDRGEVPEAGRLFCACGSLDRRARAERVGVETFILLLAELVDRRAEASRGSGRDVLRRAARREVDTFKWFGFQFLEHLLPLGIRELEHLRRGGDLAVHLAKEAVLADGHEGGERPLDVAGAERLVELAARSEHGVEGVGAERAVFVLERRLEGLHRRVVDGLPLREEEVAEARGRVLSLAADGYVAVSVARLVNQTAE